MSKGHSPFSKTTKLFPKALKAFIVGMIFSAGILGTGKVAFATDSTLTITLSENAVTANVAPTATPSGTFVQSSGMTVGVSTNHISGYTLSISASDTTTPGRLKNGSSYLQSIASETTLNNFKNADLSNSDLATSLGLSDCTQITESSNCKGIWGYKPSKLNSSTNENFLPTPGTSGNTIDVTSGPNATPIEYTITLGAKVSPLATVGSYTNTFVLMAVGNNIPYTMEFSENTVENMPVNILDGSSPDTQAIIPSGTPTRDGYEFLGWCDQPTTKSGNNDTCATGHSHQPGDTISLNQTGANNIKLYAIWEKEKEPISVTVTFKVVNGLWDDDKTNNDRVVILTGVEGDELKLELDDLPYVGWTPYEGYGMGSYDVVPSLQQAITEDVTYTYTYELLDP